MNEENDKRLMKAYPELLRQRHLPMTETCLCWGFCCGDGWYDLLNTALGKLDIYCKKNNVKVDADSDIWAVQRVLLSVREAHLGEANNVSLRIPEIH